MRRTSDEVAKRALALLMVAVKGETRDHEFAQDVAKEFEALPYFSPLERVFFLDETPTEQDYTNAIWRYEAAFVLLWALGFYDTMDRPGQIVDVATMASIVRELGADGVLSKAKLRPQSELLDASDLAYRYHWASVSARLGHAPIPNWMEPSTPLNASTH